MKSLKRVTTIWTGFVVSEPSFNTNLTKSVLTFAVESDHICTDFNVTHAYRTLITNKILISLKMFKLLYSLISQSFLVWWVSIKVYEIPTVFVQLKSKSFELFNQQSYFFVLFFHHQLPTQTFVNCLVGF